MIRLSPAGVASVAPIGGGDAVVDQNGTIYVTGSRTVRKLSNGTSVSHFRQRQRILRGRRRQRHQRKAECADRPMAGCHGITLLHRLTESTSARIDGRRTARYGRKHGLAKRDRHGHSGNLFISDTSANRVRRLAPDGTMTTIVGSDLRRFDGDGGPASAALLNQPFGLAIGSDNSLYIADSGNNLIRRVSPGGVISTAATGLSQPMGVAVDSAGLSISPRPPSAGFTSSQAMDNLRVSAAVFDHPQGCACSTPATCRSPKPEGIV